MASQEQVDEFWNWFSENASRFGEDFANEALVRQLDDRVARLGDFSWELGPGGIAESAFVLSPGGNRELLASTEAIVAAAPSVSGWEFHSAKPPKQWEGRFELDVNGNPIAVDASTWRCVLLKYADGLNQLVVEAPNLSSLPDDYQRWAAEIALDGLMGERRRLVAIDEVSVVPELSARESAAAFPIAVVTDRVGDSLGREG